MTRTAGRRTPSIALAFSGPKAARLAGITYRRLDYWARKRFVEPSVQVSSGSGIFRLYSSADILALKVAKRLREEGVSLPTIRRAVAALDDGQGSARVLTSYTFQVSRGRLFAVTKDSAIDVAQDGQLAFAIAFELTESPTRKPLAPATRRMKRPLARARTKTSATLLEETLHLSENRR